MKATNSLFNRLFPSVVGSASAFVIGLKVVGPNKPMRSSTAQSNKDRNDSVSQAGQQNPLSDLLEAQLCGSSMIYTFAAVRDFVRDNRTSLDWYRPDLILTQHTAKEANKDRTHIPKHLVEKATPHIYRRYLKHPITADAVKKFITNEKNAEILSEKMDAFDTGKWEDDFNVLENLHRLTEFNGDIVEFDDQFDEKQLVYALTVNRSDKRITVCFRGSVWGGRDWPTNLNLFFETVETPKMIKEDGFEDAIRVHRGFNSYLNDRKFNDILGHILDLYENPLYKDYELQICGHSLGGALSALLGFKLASSGKLLQVLDGRPITVMSFASPQVGDAGYSAAFRSLESKGYLQHVRVSSQGDLVPVFPTGFGLYQQTGVNLHLFKDSRMEVEYGESKSFASQVGLRPVKNHSLIRYYRRLMMPVNQVILGQAGSVQGLYDNHSKEELVRPRRTSRAEDGTHYHLSSDLATSKGSPQPM